MQVVCVAAYKRFASHYSESLRQPEEDVMQTSPGGDSSNSRMYTQNGHVAKRIEPETNTFVVE